MKIGSARFKMDSEGTNQRQLHLAARIGKGFANRLSILAVLLGINGAFDHA